MHVNAQQRVQVLEILYNRLSKKPHSAWVSEREINKLGEVEFALVCLKELGQARKDGLNWHITGPGILAYEAADEV